MRLVRPGVRPPQMRLLDHADAPALPLDDLAAVIADVLGGQHVAIGLQSEDGAAVWGTSGGTTGTDDCVAAGTLAALGTVYAELLPRAGVLLDLMSSWRTHLSSELAGAPDLEVVGQGMNAEEMSDNPQLSRHLVHDLNRQPRLPFPDAAFDGAICTVSVQYMTRPVEIFSDVARVLKLGGPFLISFSNRCFPTKAVAVWQSTSDDEHIQLVGNYFARSGLWGQPEAGRFTPATGDPLSVVWAFRT